MNTGLLIWMGLMVVVAFGWDRWLSKRDRSDESVKLSLLTVAGIALVSLVILMAVSK
jgi:hypothetical protein